MRPYSRSIRYTGAVGSALLALAIVPLTIVGAQAATVTVADVAQSAGVSDVNVTWSACETARWSPVRG